MCSRSASISAAFILMAALLASAASDSPTDQSPEFASLRLIPEGSPDVEVFEDLDSDGDIDIMLFDNRRISVFLSENGVFSAEPDFCGDAPEEASFLDVGDVQGQGIREHIYMSRNGVFRLSYSAEERRFAPIPVFERKIALLPNRVKELAVMDFFQDLTGDGREDLLIPEIYRYLILENQGDGTYENWGEIGFMPRADYYTESLSQTGRLKEVVHLPRLFSGKGAGAEIVVLYDGLWITHYQRDAEKGFKVTDRRPLYGRDSREYEESSRAYFGKNVYFDDLNADGTHELVIAHNRDGKIDFFKGGESEEHFQSDMTIRTEGWILPPVFKDLNGDERKDLILPSIEKIGGFTILRIFFTSRFDIQYMIFFNREKPLYPVVPDFSRTVSLPLSFTAGPEGVSITHSLIYSFGGDFNIDGLSDLLLRNSPRSLGVFFGNEGEDFAEEVGVRLDFNPLAHCSSVTTRVTDINLDGCSDIFLHQASLDDGKDAYDLYLSTK